jgi:hypothetical protein
MKGSNMNRDIGKLANIFGRSMGNVSINKLFSSYFEADFSGSGKIEQITYLLTKHKDNPKELQYIVQEIINNHSSVTAKNIEPINNSLLSLNLNVDPKTHQVGIIKAPIHDAEMVLNTIVTEIPLKFEGILPPEMIEKAKKMAQAYMIIYCIENSLRIFVDKISTEQIGTDYWNHLKISKDLRDNIDRRKKDEQNNLFHALRGDKELYYLDLDDLGKVIQLNWDFFKNYFPNLPFILQKISEIKITRNNVAHNGTISDDDFTRVLLHYKDILKQINR